ncbi:MAG: efflux RND transporter permease subunit [Bacteroidales bacterium]|jgi:multidrug efflux pump subunit AcrB|nr:efflux RND transporter permease subunit [Bacteroidales bacterium]
MKERRDLISWAMKYHGILIFVVSVMVLFGVFALLVMPKNEFPSFTIRQGLVVAVYPGADTKQMENEVTKPLEDFIFGFKDVKKKKTVSKTRDGIVFITVVLNDNVKDKEEFWAKFKLRLAQFKNTLPPGVLALQANDDFGDTSAMLIALESGQKTYRQLRDYMDELCDRLRAIDAVSNLKRYGEQKEQISLYIDPDKLSEYGIKPSALAINMITSGFKTAAGSIKNDKYVAPIHMTESFDEEEDIAQHIVFTSPSGDAIRLKDIAVIKREYPQHPDSYITNNGKKCILLSMEMRNGHNIVKMGNDVNKILGQFKKELPKDVKIYKITDQTQIVGDSVTTFLNELIIAIIAVIIVIMILMPFKVASISAITIPVTIFMSLGIFYAFGIELNTVTFAALLVTLGMIVDNSVVIIDRYVELLDLGVERKKAAVQSAREFFMSIFSATLAISITFFPFLFTTHGMINDFLQAFPWAITIILILSLFIAVMFIPFLQSKIIIRGLKEDKELDKKKALAKGKKPRTDFLSKVQTAYDNIVGKCLEHPKATLGIGGLSIMAAIIITINLPLKFMPNADRNQFAVEIFLPDGNSIEQTASVADSLEHILKKDDRITSITSFMGQGSPRFHTLYAPQLPGVNFAQFIVNTRSNKATEDLLDEYTDRYMNYFTNAVVKFKQLEFNDAANPIEVRLTGNNKKGLHEAADSVKKIMRNIKGLALVRSNDNKETPGVLLKLKQDELNRLGINKTTINLNLAMRYGSGVPVSTVWEGNYPVSVVLKTDRPSEPAISDLPNGYIGTWGGLSSVPLRQIAEITPQWTEGQIVRRNGIPCITILSEVKRGLNVNNMTKKVKAILKDVQLPSGIKISYGGIDEFDKDIIPQIYGGLGIAIFIILIILMFHFKNVSLASLVLASITLCLFGASLGLEIMGLDLSVTAILGLISLMGIIVRNGIIMLDYTEELRREGMDVYEAILSSAKRRMRPIFLTSAAASMGVIPMMLGGSSLWSALGTVVFWGTLITMIFTVTVLPAAYYLIYRKTA